jgi:A/G-specific adenine glycosylase
MAIISKSKIEIFQQKIICWFEIYGRNFDWRQSSISDYQIIVSEILLQRTKAETVSKFYNKFLLNFPDWHAIARADKHDIEKYLIPIGLFRQRAERLQRLAIFMENNNYLLPTERKELDNIPFMGQYIANAVELLIHKKNKPLLDVNMARVLERYFGPRKLVDIRYDPYLQDLALKVVNSPKSKQINWAILDFAALICKARKPCCSICILSTECDYFNNAKN